MKTLIVYWDEHTVGTLIEVPGGDMVFQYTADWIDQNHFPISVNLPLQKEPFDTIKTKVFFANLLPEAQVRRALAQKYGISEGNDFGLLNEIGGECAGALTILPHGMGRNLDGDLIEFKNEELDELIKKMPEKPLIIAHKDARLSLAGAQEKIPVYLEGKSLFLPKGSFSSSHILKPHIPTFNESVENEVFCMMLAANSGLNVPNVQIWKTQSYRCLLIERYDREAGSGKKLKRIHQEDFCQALGVPPNRKYQSEGGPKLQDCFILVANKSSYKVKDQIQLIRWIAFNYIIGNYDSHAKNISLLFKDNLIKLAPFYDLMCTEIYPNLAQKFAMKIGDYYERKNVFQRHWQQMAEEIEISWKFVKENLEECAESTAEALVTTKKNFTDLYGTSQTIESISKLIDQHQTELCGRLKE